MPNDNGNHQSSAYPHIRCGLGVFNVKWGKAGWTFILATIAALGASGVMTYRVNAGEETDARMERNLKIIQENTRILDEQTRRNEVASGLATRQLRALLHNAGITERIEPPEMRDTKIKPLE